MIKFLRRVLLAGAATLAATACGPVDERPTAPSQARTASFPPPAARAFDRSDADPALWKIADADTTIYLFGTMHALKPDLVWFDDGIAAAMAAADELVIEMVPPPAAQMQATVLGRALRQDGKTLRSTLTPENAARLEAAAKEHGLPVAAIDRMTPWFAAVTLATLPMQKLGYLGGSGSETVLTAAAKARNVPVSGLETFEEQMGFFAGLSEADQVVFLTSTLESMEGAAALFERMERTWATGDVEDTAALVNEVATATPGLARVLLDERNARWAAWIEERLGRPGTVLVAVGSGHLAGPKSVQAALAERGIAATRVE